MKMLVDCDFFFIHFYSKNTFFKCIKLQSISIFGQKFSSLGKDPLTKAQMMLVCKDTAKQAGRVAVLGLNLTLQTIVHVTRNETRETADVSFCFCRRGTERNTQCGQRGPSAEFLMAFSAVSQLQIAFLTIWQTSETSVAGQIVIVIHSTVCKCCKVTWETGG